MDKTKKFGMLGSMLSTFLIVFLLTYAIALFVQNNTIGNVVRIFAGSDINGDVEITASISGYDEVSSTNVVSNKFLQLNSKSDENWNVGNLVFAKNAGNAVPIIFTFLVDNKTDGEMVFSFNDKLAGADTQVVGYDFSINGVDYSSNFNENDANIEGNAVKTFYVRLSVLDTSISFEMSPISFTISVEGC